MADDDENRAERVFRAIGTLLSQLAPDEAYDVVTNLCAATVRATIHMGVTEEAAMGTFVADIEAMVAQKAVDAGEVAVN
jgi:hypothetical protein